MAKQTSAQITADIQSKMVNQIIDLMETHGTGWTKPWATSGGGRLPENIASKKRYRGINVLMLGMAGFSSNVWGTYKQWAGKKAQVMKGSKSTTVIFWKPLEITDKATGEKKTIWMLRTYNVFNADQVEGWEAPAAPEPLETPAGQPFDPLECIAEMALRIGVEVRHGGEQAFYSPSSDHVQMPETSSFIGTATSTPFEAYHSTFFHELAHATGHKSRLDRLTASPFGGKGYAFEELVAELTAVFLGVSEGVSAAPRADHAQYLASWLKALKAEPKMLFKAATEAAKAFDMLSPEAVATEADVELELDDLAA